MKKILTLLALVIGIILPSMAQKATPDSVFVVKNGRIFSAYEVGKDVDNISFNKKVVVSGNSVVVGNETIELKSAVYTMQGEYVYGFFSSQEGLTTMEEIMNSPKYLMVAMSPDLLAENVNFKNFDTEFADNYFMITYVDNVKLKEEGDDYEPVSIASDDWTDYCADGSLYMDFEDDDLVMNFSIEPNDGVEAFAGSYKGAYTIPASNPYYFTIDGNKSKVRTVFAKQEDDGIAFYITSGNIDNANDLDNCHYYARLFVPTSEMDGTDIDINGNREYELTFYDNVSDINNPQQISLSNGKTGNATGYVSVLDRGDGSYTLTIDVENMGNEGNRSFQAFYRGTPAVYDLTLPSEYTVAGSEPVTLKSCVVVVDSSDEDRDMYTVYLSSKEGVTTVEGMADADIVLTVPDDFINDDMTHGFSGTDINAMLSIAYGGDTYCQATTSDPVTSIAVGGNIKATLNAGKGNFDFMVFGASKFGGNIKGHYEGEVTKLTK